MHLKGNCSPESWKITACRQATNCTRHSAGLHKLRASVIFESRTLPFSYLSRNLYFRAVFYTKSSHAVKQAVASKSQSIARFARKCPPRLESTTSKKTSQTTTACRSVDTS